MKLTLSVHAEDGSLWAEVAELPGCFAAGVTLDELFKSLSEGIALYLESGQASASRRSQLAPILSP